MTNFGITKATIGHEYNPFLDKVKLKEKTQITKIADAPDKKIVDKDGKTVENVSVVYAEEHSYDRTKFIKVYHGDLDFLNDLSKIGIKLFTYIIKNLRWNQDTILFNVKLFCEETGYKNTNKVYIGMKELEKAELLAKHSIPNVYWINPSIIYNGERKYLFLT